MASLMRVSVQAPLQSFGVGILPTARGRWMADNLAPISRQSLPGDDVGTATLTFTGLPAGTDIVVLAAGTSTVLHQVDAHAGTSYGYLYGYPIAGAAPVDVGFIKPGFVPFYIRNLARPKFDSSIPVALDADRNYS